MHKKLYIVCTLVAALAASVIAWTQSNATLGTNITAGGAGGKVISSITEIGESFSITLGVAQKISGIELYKIELADPQFSNLIRVNVILTNSSEMGQVLNNPNSFIKVAIYYPDPNNASGTILDGGVDIGTHVLKDTGSRASGVISRTVGDILLYPSVIGQDTLYVLASISTPSGPPPGQQLQMNELGFYIRIDIGTGGLS